MWSLYFTQIVALLNQCPLNFVQDYNTPGCGENFAEKSYDFIVVGGGSAGNVLANRLSENPEWNVLLLEAGGYPSNLSQIPAAFFMLQKTEEDWQFYAEKGEYCKGLRNGRCYWPQGKMLGGGSGINAMLSVRGNRRDYNHWASLGNPGWDWESLQKYFVKAEETLKRTKIISPSPLRKILLDGIESLGLPMNEEGQLLGYEDIYTTIYEKQRHSTARAYISPVKNRPNLCVRTKTRVDRVIFEAKERPKDIPKAIGVEIETGVKIYTKKEVILSASAIGSPKLLKLSGVGPKSELKKLGIPVIKNIKGVGKNLQDHLMLPSYVVSLDLNIPEYTNENFINEYVKNKDGPFGTMDLTSIMGWINTRNDSNYPNIQIHHMTMYQNDTLLLPITCRRMNLDDECCQTIRNVNEKKVLFQFMPTLLNPQSRGEIKLRSKYNKDPPLIFPNYLDADEDMDILVGAVTYLNNLISTESFQSKGASLIRLGDKFCGDFEYNSKEYWMCYIRHYATTLYHPSGTCRMGPSYEPSSVVSPELKVHGISGLRVVDASIMPILISGNTNIPVITIAEHASQIIKDNYA